MQTPEIDALRPRAEQGDAQAQYDLWHIYADGHGVPQDYGEARRWWQLAAAQHDPSDEAVPVLIPLSDGTAAGQDHLAAGAPPDDRTTALARGIIDGPRPPVAPAVIVRDQSGRVTMRAVRLDEPLTLDGQLDEPVPITDRAGFPPNRGGMLYEEERC